MLDLYIVGAGGLGRGLADALLMNNNMHLEQNYANLYFVDDNAVGKEVNDIFVKYNLNDFIKLKKNCLVINAIGKPENRKGIQKKLNTNRYFSFPNYIDTDVKLYKHIEMGMGNIITRGVVFSTNIKIGDFNLIHFNSTVGHDVKIGDYNCIYPLTSLSGYTILNDGNMFGTNSSTLPGINIGSNNVIGANSFIQKSITSNKIMVGSPAREKE